MQFHPGDTGGAFFELDWDPKNEPEGHWEPAGGDGWDKAQRTDVITRYSTVELQAHEPQAMAEGWAAIAGIAVKQDGYGQTYLPLENADVRFIEATDGRGDGLGGIDLVVADRQRLPTIAEQRGCRVSDSQVGRRLKDNNAASFLGSGNRAEDPPRGSTVNNHIMTLAFRIDCQGSKRPCEQGQEVEHEGIASIDLNTEIFHKDFPGWIFKRTLKLRIGGTSVAGYFVS